jgi:hypothetical protein
MLRVKFWLLAILFTACAVPQSKVIFLPDSVQNNVQEQAGRTETWEIIESQNGSGEAGIPVWLRSYLDNGVRGIESLEAYNGKYVFVGKNQGDNFNALHQWAQGFSATQDLPRLIVQRVEQRLVSSAALYPDDEYGEYFASMIKKVSDEEYPGAVKEQIFWVKQKRIPGSGEDEDDSEIEIPPADTDLERYEFLILLSMDKEILQTTIQNIMANIKTSAAPTREQTAAINKIRHTFFEGF